MLEHARALAVLDRDFPEARCKILEIAAILDRIDRRPHTIPNIPTRGTGRFARPSRHSANRGPGRRETIQLIFSLEYESNWRTGFGI